MFSPLLALGLLAGSSAQAQNRLPEFDVQNVRPSIDSRRTLLTDDAGLAPSNSFMGRLVFSQAADLLTFTPTGSTEEFAVLKNLMTGHLMGAYTISASGWDSTCPWCSRPPRMCSRVRVGSVTWPSICEAPSSTPPTPPSGWPFRLALGYPRLLLTFRLADPESATRLPLSSTSAWVVSWPRQTWASGAVRPLKLDNVTVGNQFATRLGVGYQLSANVGVSGDVAGYLLATTRAIRWGCLGRAARWVVPL